MKRFLAVVLCFVAPVIAQNNDCNTISGSPVFDFEDLIKYQYRYVLLPDTERYRSYRHAEETSVNIKDKYYSIFHAIKKDGTQVTNNYQIDKVEGSTMYQSIIKNGVPTGDTVSITFYSYKPLEYAQFYACFSKGTEQDYRYAVLFGDKKLTDELKQELLENDAAYEFNGRLIFVGQ